MRQVQDQVEDHRRGHQRHPHRRVTVEDRGQREQHDHHAGQCEPHQGPEAAPVCHRHDHDGEDQSPHPQRDTARVVVEGVVRRSPRHPAAVLGDHDLRSGREIGLAGARGRGTRGVDAAVARRGALAGQRAGAHPHRPDRELRPLIGIGAARDLHRAVQAAAVGIGHRMRFDIAHLAVAAGCEIAVAQDLLADGALVQRGRFRGVRHAHPQLRRPQHDHADRHRHTDHREQPDDHAGRPLAERDTAQRVGVDASGVVVVGVLIGVGHARNPTSAYTSSGSCRIGRAPRTGRGPTGG
ncbi:hypothetical protein TSST111916_21125 [Tsukamurella strandjordii]